MPTASLLHGIIEQTVHNQPYILVKHEASAINKAIPEKNRFKPVGQLGTQGFIKLCYRWLKIENSTQFDCGRSDSLNALLTRKHMKIGFAPLANHEEMQWQYDADDLRADGRMPFWCASAQNEPELVNKITLALATAYQQKN
ncbi:hypothetical protein [Methylocucumis oryzae]|uniref:Uncharacterized protein n=1 Tax=Methylocucumis oryzae TaxID=1632867 RepID=A0A0F3IJ39_9GAMM|nr:hypothetical protein [Methylocucumis oryzae]KJV06677.1 hypothetical protein VZ94_09750 [Methylocucumis oryzae]